MNIDAIACLIEHIDATRDEGAVLVFMPGMYEISALHAALTSNASNSKRIRSLPLHGSLSSAEQVQCLPLLPRWLGGVGVMAAVPKD